MNRTRMAVGTVLVLVLVVVGAALATGLLPVPAIGNGGDSSGGRDR
jgi:hypothetical protein